MDEEFGVGYVPGVLKESQITERQLIQSEMQERGLSIHWPAGLSGVKS